MQLIWFKTSRLGFQQWMKHVRKEIGLFRLPVTEQIIFTSEEISTLLPRTKKIETSLNNKSMKENTAIIYPEIRVLTLYKKIISRNSGSPIDWASLKVSVQRFPKCDPKTSTSVSFGKLWKMPTIKPLHKYMESKDLGPTICFNKPCRWLWCIKFENLWLSKIQCLTLSLEMWMNPHFTGSAI